VRAISSQFDTDDRPTTLHSIDRCCLPPMPMARPFLAILFTAFLLLTAATVRATTEEKHRDKKKPHATFAPTPLVLTTGGLAPEGSRCVFPFYTRDAKTKKRTAHHKCIPFVHQAPYVNASMRVPVPLGISTWCYTGPAKATYSKKSAVRAHWGFCAPVAGAVESTSSPSSSPSTAEPSRSPTASPAWTPDVLISAQLEVLLGHCDYDADPFSASIDGVAIPLNFSNAPWCVGIFFAALTCAFGPAAAASQAFRRPPSPWSCSPRRSMSPCTNFSLPRPACLPGCVWR